MNDSKDYTSEQIEEFINKYHQEERQKVIDKIKKRIIPYLLDKAYKNFENKKYILAFSHRRVGWSFPNLQLSNEFEVIFKTNFGYGSSSYFFTNIKYKKID